LRFLADHDVYAVTIRLLQALGHDVLPVAQQGLSSAEDSDLLRVARKQGRILVTRDRDFGRLFFVFGLGPGVLCLRALPSTQNAVHADLERALRSYPEGDLQTAFVVVEPGRHRFRRLGP